MFAVLCAKKRNLLGANVKGKVGQHLLFHQIILQSLEINKVLISNVDTKIFLSDPGVRNPELRIRIQEFN
jgi:hypothetical protein